MTVEAIGQDAFNEHVVSHNIVVGKFGATWCGPCKALAPILEQVSQEFPNISFVDIDVDQSPALAAEFNIRSVPTLVAWKAGKVQWVKIGLPNLTALRGAIQEL